MPRRGDVFENRVTGERAVVLRGGEDATAESALVHLTASPGAAVVGEHVHPTLHERFHVISGRLGARVDGRDIVLGPGEEASVLPGVVHDWWNAGDRPAEVVVEVGPPRAVAERFALILPTLFGLANAGMTNAKGMPRPLQLAVIATEFADVIRFTKPPETVQRLIMAPLAAIARRRGYRATYPEFAVPHGHTEPDPAALRTAGLAVGPGGAEVAASQEARRDR